MIYWPPKLIAIISYFIKIAYNYQYFDQYLRPNNHAFLLVFYGTKPSISFLTSKLLCAIGLKRLYSLHPISLKLAIIYKYCDQYLSPINPAFL